LIDGSVGREATWAGVYTVYNVPDPTNVSAVVTVRLTRELERRLAREARRSRRTRSEVARDILAAHLSSPVVDPQAEARRQSLLASSQDADRDTLTFIEQAGDPRGWK
jgi:predicted transcriptional regulator